MSYNRQMRLVVLLACAPSSPDGDVAAPELLPASLRLPVRPWQMTPEERAAWEEAQWARCPERRPTPAAAGSGPVVRPAPVQEVFGLADPSAIPGVGAAVPGEGDETGGIARVVRAARGRFETCLPNALVMDLCTHGRIGVGWQIVGGKVTEASLTQNTTGKDQLGACFVKVVQRLRFEPEITAAVDGWAWIIRGE